MMAGGTASAKLAGAFAVMLGACGARTDLQRERDSSDAEQLPACVEDGEWTQVGDLAAARIGPAVAALEGGDAIVAGGTDVDVLDSVERYDGASGSFSLIGKLIAPRTLFAAVTLQDGRVLLTGGFTGGADGSGAGVKFSELVDPATNEVAVTSDMPIGRYFHSMATLPNGHVLVVGGFQLDVEVDKAAVYDPTVAAWEEIDAKPSVAGGYTQAVANAHGAYVLARDGVYDFDGDTFTKMDFGDYEPAFDVPIATRWRDGFASVQNNGNIWAFADGELHWTRLWIPNPDVAPPFPTEVLPLCDAFFVFADKEYRLRFEPPPLEATWAHREIREQRGVRLENGQLLLVGGRDSFGEASRRAELFR